MHYTVRAMKKQLLWLMKQQEIKDKIEYGKKLICSGVQGYTESQRNQMFTWCIQEAKKFAGQDPNNVWVCTYNHWKNARELAKGSVMEFKHSWAKWGLWDWFKANFNSKRPLYPWSLDP
eukprot:9839716-Karenia_brevis.AAC.1